VGIVYRRPSAASGFASLLVVVVIGLLPGAADAQSSPEYLEIAGSPFAVSLGDGDIGTEAAVFSPGGSLLATANDAGNGVSMFSVASGGGLTPIQDSSDFEYEFPAGQAPVSVAFSPNGTLLATANSGDDTVSVFSVSVGGQLTQITGSPFATGSDPVSVAFSPDGTRLATANRTDATVSVFSVSVGGQLTQVSGSPYAVDGSYAFSVAFNASGSLLAAANGTGVSVFSVAAGGQLTQATDSPFFDDGADSAAFSPDGTLLAAGNDLPGGNPGTVSIFSVGSGGKLTAVTGSPYTTDYDPASVAFSPDGGYVAVANQDSTDTVSVFSIGSGGQLTQLANSPMRSSDNGVVGVLHSVAFSPNSTLLATANAASGTGENLAGTVSVYRRYNGLSSTSLSSSLNPVYLGQHVTYTATVTSSLAGTLTGTVSFSDGSSAISGCTAVAVSDGTAQCTVPYATDATLLGTHQISAAYSGDTNYAPSSSANVAEQVDMRDTTSTTSSSANPSVVGQQVTYTATVAWTPATVPDAGGTPVGTVRFEDGGTTISGCVPQLSNGVAVCKVTYATPSASPHQITAVYNGTPYDNTSTSTTLDQSVDAAGTATSLMSSANPSDPGQQVTYTASVGVNAPGAGSPTGTVAFTDRGATISGCGAVAVSSGSAVCSVTYPIPAGSPHHVVATYSGDTDFASSASSIFTQTVNGTSSSTSVSSSANPSVSGQPVTYTATVSGVGSLTGTVAFTDGGTTISGCGAAALSGGTARCSVTYPGTSASPHQIVATYSGDSTFQGSDSSTLGQGVNKAETSTSLASSANPADTGHQVTYTASVAVGSPGAGSPSGTVAFTDGGATISGCGAVAVADGVAHCAATYTAASGSPYAISAGYSGDADYASSSTGPLAQTVRQVSSGFLTPTVSVSSSPNPSVSAQRVTYTASVSGDGGGTPTGAVAFKDGGSAIPGCGSVALKGGVARCSVIYRGSAGSPHRVAASYSGDPMFAAGSSPRLSQVVRRAATKLEAASVHSTSRKVTFSVRLTRVFDGTPVAAMTIAFSSHGHRLCAAKTTRKGIATCAVARHVTSGRAVYKAVFAGDPDYLPSSTRAKDSKAAHHERLL
jgi:WD40 repeat protein